MQLRRTWCAIWLAVLHTIWAHMNAVAFHGTSICVETVDKVKSWLWLKHSLKDFMLSFFEWESNPCGCIIYNRESLDPEII